MYFKLQVRSRLPISTYVYMNVMDGRNKLLVLSSRGVTSKSSHLCIMYIQYLYLYLYVHICTL